MSAVNRKIDVVDMLYDSFHEREGEYLISSRGIAFIFHGGLYGINEIENTILSHDVAEKEGENILIIDKQINLRHGRFKKSVEIYVNLPFLAKIIEKITDDEDDIKAFGNYFARNIEIRATTTPMHSDMSLMLCEA